MNKNLIQLVVYIIVGVTATAVDYSFFVVLTRVFNTAALWANPFAYIAGNIVSFLGHRKVTFRSSNRPLFEYARFVTVTVVGLSISQFVLAGLLEMGVYDLVAKVVAVLVSGTFNYTVNRFWTFRPTGGK